MRRPTAIAALLLVCAVDNASHGAEVSFSISARETWVGIPVTIQVAIKNAQEHAPPVLPVVDGADVVLDGPSSQSFTSITFGRREHSTTYTYSVRITPRRAGTLTIPPIRVNADGEWSESASATIVAKESETGNLLFLEIVGDRDSVYVGEPIDVTLEVWLKPFVGQGQGVRLDENSMWRFCVDVRNSSWGPFAEVIDSGQVKVRKDTRRDDQGRSQRYFVYLLRHSVWPERPGRFDASDVNVVVRYPLSVRRNRFSLFAPDYSVADARPIYAVVQDVSIEVKAPPTEGQPVLYRGAVGRYSMKVTAVPTEVSVGDPITINIALRGSGRLDLLRPPPLTLQEALTADFKVPDEELAGIVENGVKTFSQSIRAKRDDVTEVPPIAFAYFDPQSERYVTLKSDPIAIQVKESTRMAVSQVVEGGSRPGVPTALTLLDAGLWTNYDDVSELLAHQSVVPGVGALGFAAGMPMVYALLFVVTRFRDRVRGDEGFARRRRARKTAISTIARAAGSDGAASAAEVSGALTRYVADRCNLPPGGVTRADAVKQLRDRHVPEEIVLQLDALLSECENAQYAGVAQSGANDLAGRAKRCINELERRKI